MKNNKLLFFADVQQDIPQYLCADEDGLYLCTVGQANGKYVEQQIQKIDIIEARIFIAKTFNKAMKSIGEKI